LILVPLIFKREKLKRKVSLKKDARDGIISYCKMKHPNEAVLILRGKSKKGNITIDGLIIPPFSYTDTKPDWTPFLADSKIVIIFALFS